MSGAKLIERHLASKDAEISRLQSRIEELERALKPFAGEAGLYDYDTAREVHYCNESTIPVELGDLRQARSVLEASNKGSE